MLSILRASLLTAITTFGTILAGLVRAKLTALWLGRGGVGIVSQSQNVALLLGSIGSLGVGTGLLAGASRAHSRGDHAGVASLVDSALVVIGVPSVLMVLGGLGGGRWLGPALFGDDPLTWLALVAALVGGAANAAQPIPGSMLYAHGKVRTYVISSLISTAVGLVSLIALMLGFGLRGALLHIALGPILTLLVLGAITQRELPKEVALVGRWPLKPTRKGVTELLAYAVYTVVASGTYYLSQVTGRGLVLHRLGVELNGVLQAAVAIGSYLRQLISGGLTADLFPNAAQVQRTPGELETMVKGGQRFFLAVALPGAIVLAMFGDLVVRILYSREFVGAAAILGVYLVGEVLRMLAVIPTTVLSARKALVAAAAPIVLGEGAFLGAFVLTADHGLPAYALAWGVGGLVSLWTAVAAARISIGVKLSPLYLVIITLTPIAAGVGLHYLPASIPLRIALAAATLLAAWELGLRTEERAALLARFTRGFRRARS